jgi:uncharacterized membrane protein YbaN (DUF454 family)
MYEVWLVFLVVVGTTIFVLTPIYFWEKEDRQKRRQLDQLARKMVQDLERCDADGVPVDPWTRARIEKIRRRHNL